MRNGFKTTDTEENEFIELFMDDIKKFTQDYIKRLFRDVNTNLLRRFKKEFEQDENGKRRNWVLMETEQIQDAWTKCKSVIEECFKHFKYIELAFELDPSITTPGEPIDPQNINLEEEKELGQIDSKNKSRSNSMLYGRLLSETEINKVRDRFNEDTQNLLEDAMRKHNNLGSGGAPLWLYCLLVYFAYDDIFRMLMNPLLFYPTMLAVSIAGLLYSMGLGPMMVPAVTQSVNMGLRGAGVPFQV